MDPKFAATTWYVAFLSALFLWVVGEFNVCWCHACYERKFFTLFCMEFSVY